MRHPIALPVTLLLLARDEEASLIGPSAKTGVSSIETETEYTPPLSTRPVRTTVLRYELTESGKTFYREKDRVGLGGTKEVRGDLCYGQQALDKIIKWEGPTAVGDSKEASVFYTYKIDNFAEWAKSSDLQRVFPGIVSTIAGGRKDTDESVSDTDHPRMAARRTRQPLLGRYIFLVRRTATSTGIAILSSLQLPEAFRTALGGLLATLRPSLTLARSDSKVLGYLSVAAGENFSSLTGAIKRSKKDITYSFCVLILF